MSEMEGTRTWQVAQYIVLNRTCTRHCSNQSSDFTKTYFKPLWRLVLGRVVMSMHFQTVD